MPRSRTAASRWSPAPTTEVLPTDDTGCIRADVVAAMEWTPVEVPAGATLWFHSRTPHRSGPNRSAVPRRALYPTYNAPVRGRPPRRVLRREARQFAAGRAATGADRVQVSLIGDFQGREV